MTGYTRQSIADIIPGNDVDAEPLNKEFDALQDAFHGVTGHTHDGGSGNAPKISLTSAVSGFLPISNMDVTEDAALLLADEDVPRLSTSNTWTSVQTFTGNNPIVISCASPIINITDTDTGVDHSINANTADGRIVYHCDFNSEGSLPVHDFRVKGVNKLSIGETNVALASNQAITFAGTGAATTRTNLGLGTSATVNTGTSGATIPLLNASNTWSSAQIITSNSGTGSLQITSSLPTIKFTDTDTGVENVINGNSSTGSFFIQCDPNSAGSAPVLSLAVAGSSKINISSTEMQFSVPVNNIRLSSTSDASPSSTGHAFQIGPTSGSNLIADGDEIISRNNGSLSTLGLHGSVVNVGSGDGGANSVNIGAGSTDIVLNGTTFVATSGLYFGGGTSNDLILFSDSTNTYTFIADNTTNATVLGGRFITSFGDDETWTPTLDSVGATLASNGSSVGLIAATADGTVPLILKRITNDGPVATFRRTGTTNVGSISVTTSATAFNTSSDIRLKTDFQSINPDLLDQIKVYDFEWKNGDGRAYGVVAQELVDILPQAVNQGDEEDDMWSVDYSKLVPLLISTVQDLKREVVRLKEELNG